MDAEKPAQMPDGLRRAIKAAGGVSKMSKAVGVSRAAIYQWIETGYVTPQRAVQLESLYKVSRRDLIDPRVYILLDGTVNQILDSGAMQASVGGLCK